MSVHFSPIDESKPATINFGFSTVPIKPYSTVHQCNCVFEPFLKVRPYYSASPQPLLGINSACGVPLGFFDN
jgi:hypothetical protein